MAQGFILRGKSVAVLIGAIWVASACRSDLDLEPANPDLTAVAAESPTPLSTEITLRLKDGTETLVQASQGAISFEEADGEGMTHHCQGTVSGDTVTVSCDDQPGCEIRFEKQSTDNEVVFVETAVGCATLH